MNLGDHLKNGDFGDGEPRLLIFVIDFKNKKIISDLIFVLGQPIDIKHKLI